MGGSIASSSLIFRVSLALICALCSFRVRPTAGRRSSVLLRPPAFSATGQFQPIRENQTFTKFWSPSSVAFASSSQTGIRPFPVSEIPPFLREALLLFLQDLQYEVTRNRGLHTGACLDLTEKTWRLSISSLPRSLNPPPQKDYFTPKISQGMAQKKIKEATSGISSLLWAGASFVLQIVCGKAFNLQVRKVFLQSHCE